MNEQDGGTTELEWTPMALGFARAYYAGAMLAARHRPEDQHSQQRAAEAWDDYREAARKAGLGSALQPGDFAHAQD